MLRTLLALTSLLISACTSDDDSSLPDGGLPDADSDGSMNSDGGIDGLPAWCGEINQNGYCTGSNPAHWTCDPIAQDCPSGQSCYATYWDSVANKPDGTPFGFECRATGIGVEGATCGSGYPECSEGLTCLHSSMSPPSPSQVGTCRQYCTTYTDCSLKAGERCAGRDNGVNGPLDPMRQTPAGVCRYGD